jgi:urease accessory protein
VTQENRRGTSKLITANSVIGNINQDKKLREEYQTLCQKDSCEKIMISRLETQRVRMRKTTNKGTDIALILAQGTVLKKGDVVFLTKDKIITIEIEPENVAVLTLKLDDAQDHEKLTLPIRIGHILGNLHRPIKVKGEKIYVPIQAETEIELLNKIFESIHNYIDITQDKIVFEPDEGLQKHEHK